MIPGSAVRVDRSDAVVAAGLVVVVAYFAALAWAVDNWAYDRWMVLVLLPILLAVGIPIVIAVTRGDDEPLTAIAVTALCLQAGGVTRPVLRRLRALRQRRRPPVLRARHRDRELRSTTVT